MNFAAYIPLAGCFCNFFFALFVFSRAPRATINRVYFVSGVSIAVWNLGSYFLFVVDAADRETALFWARFLQVGVLYEIAAFVHLSLLIGGYNVRKWIGWLYVLQTLLVLLDLTPLYVQDVRYLGHSGWYAIAGPAFHAINIPYSLSFVAIFFLWRKRKTLPALQRRRLTTLISAQILLAVLGINDLLPILGRDHYPFTGDPGIQVYPYGSLAVVFYGVIVAYSVLHHQLLEVRVALSNALAHFVRFAFLFTIAGGMLIAVATFTQSFSVAAFWFSIGIFVVSSITATLMFPRLFGGKGLETLERRIMGDRFEYQEQIRNFTQNIAWYNDLNPLFNDLHELLVQVFGLASYQIILRDETNRAFATFRSHPEQPQRQLPGIKSDSPVFRFFESGKSEYLTLNAVYLRPAASNLEREALKQLSEFNGQFCFALASQSEPFGLFIVGEKSSGEPFTSTDVQLLVELVKSMGLIVNQIRLKTQLLQNQELDLLGRMSRGMAHDLNNLMTPVWTLLQLSSESGNTSFDDELLPTALRNLNTMRSYIREALFFSENLRPDFQLGRLDVLVAQAAEVARVSRKKPVTIAIHATEEVLVEMDEVLVQRLIANVIANAIDASPSNSTIAVEMEGLPKTEASRDWLRLKIIDQGEGIRKEDINRVFTPYFTTKTHGDEGRGFGLGLAICRKIVNLHSGNLSILSDLRKGTTVQIDLPTRQIRPNVPTPMQPA